MRIPNFSFDLCLYQDESTLVYAGVRLEDDSPVVAKLVTGGARDLNVELVLLQKLAGAGVVEALGVFESSDGPALVLRRFGQRSLAEAIAGQPLSLERALRIGLTLAETLQRVHAARILHRDVKPANVLLDERNDAVLLADFGTAIELPVQTNVLPVSDLIGTPAYIAPEQTGRTREGADTRSDLYSLGVTLYEMLTGSVPFAGDDLLDLVAGHLSRPVEPPSARNPSLPQIVSEIVLKLLEKAKERRYQSARGLARDLARCLSALAQTGSVAAFELGRSDLVRPRVSSELYGRERERAVFEAALARSAANAPTLLLLSGREGFGRRSFAREMTRAAGQRCLCAEGGWKAANEGPLAGLSDALNALAAGLLLLDDARLAQLRQRVSARLGQVGQVIVDIAPALGDVLGPQPELAPLGPSEARGRLRHAFRSFVAALAEELPFVLVLNDLELADAASLSLVEALFDSAEDTRVLVVLTARDVAAFGVLREHQAAVSLELGPLSLEAATSWASALLGQEPLEVAELSAVLHAKAVGNPSMFLSFVEHLIEMGIIERSDGRFRWEIERVQAERAPPSVAALAAQRVADLSPELCALLTAIACGDVRCDARALSQMAAQDLEEVQQRLVSLERQGLVERSKEGGYALSHGAIASSLLGLTSPAEQRELRARLGAHLLRTLDESQLRQQALRVSAALGDESRALSPEERGRAAALCGDATEQAIAVMGYEAAASCAQQGIALLGPERWTLQRELAFRLTIGWARALTMLAKHEEADQLLKELCARDLDARELGIVYPSRTDLRTTLMDRAGAIEVGLEGLARLGLPLPAEPSREEALAPLMRNQQRLARMTLAEHENLPLATDERAIAAQKIISTLSSPLSIAGRATLFLLSLEVGLELNLNHGHTRYYASYLSVHSLLLHSRLGNYDAAWATSQACQAVQAARPAPEIDGRTYLVLYFLIYSWFRPWAEAEEPLARGMRLAIEAGDPVFTALLASSRTTLHTLAGQPLERVVATIESFGSTVRADGGVSLYLSAVLQVHGKLLRGEPIEAADVERVSQIDKAAGGMRNNALVALALPLLMLGYELEVRGWLEQLRASFPLANSGQPHIATIWLLDGVVAARDARRGQSERLLEVEKAIAALRKLEEQTRSGNHQAALTLLEAELSRAKGEPERAAGLYGRAVHEARGRGLLQLVAFASEQRAELLAETGNAEEALLFFRETVAAYARWGNQTKVQQLELLHPTLRTLEGGRGIPHATKHKASGTRTKHERARTEGASARGTATLGLNHSLDLTTVLKVSQEISTQLSASAVVRAVLLGIAQNAGAERVLLLQRSAGAEEVVYGEAQGGEYRDVGLPLSAYVDVPLSVLRVARRTGRSLIVDDASAEPAHASDPFVVARGCRSIAVIPILRKGEISGFVVLENRLVAGAFTPQLIALTQALVAQAAISLDNALLYENMEQRVTERTAALNGRTQALNARNEEMRLVLDNVAQGLVMADRTGKLSPERSAVLTQWFPEGMPETLNELLAHDALFACSWDQLLDGFLPVELCLDQLPKLMPRMGRTLELGWQPILDGAGELLRMLLVLSDITELRRRQDAEREQKEMMAIFERLMEDRGGVVEFMKEASHLVRELEHANHGSEVDKRLVHTLKGNAGMFGLLGLSTLCHEIESAMIGNERGLSLEERAAISGTWQTIEQRVGRFLSTGTHYIQVARVDYEAALQALVRDGSAVAHELELWKLEPLETRFQRIGEQAQALARRLGKAPIRVLAEHSGIRIQSEQWAPFWSAFVHAIRNTVDHGLEPAEERAELGKGIACLGLRAFFLGSSLIFEFSDDGRGIDWEKLRAKARECGYPAETHDDLVAALFLDGVSTKESADENSGRGVGMSALRDACRAMNASISIESRQGRGTTLRFEFPNQLARERGNSLLPPPHAAESKRSTPTLLV